MNYLLIGISAALGACAITLGILLAVLGSRTRRRGDARVDAVVQALEARMDELASELAGAVRRAEEEGRQSRFLAAIAGTIDLDEVLERTLEAASGPAGIDAALIRLDGWDSSPSVVAALGLSAEEAEETEGRAVAGPPDRHAGRSVELSYRYPDADRERGDELVRAGLAVPLADDSGPLGHLTVFTRDPARSFGDDDLERLEELAGRAGPAIGNARRFREARRLADLDALTGLHNRRFFHETLAREVARAHRYRRELALVVLDLDDFKEVNDRIGHLAGDAVLAEAAERVQSVVRTADVACRIGGDEFAVIVPESPLEAASLLVSRIQDAIAAHPVGLAGRLHLSAGLAALRRDDDPISFFERADEALYSAKNTGKGGAMSA